MLGVVMCVSPQATPKKQKLAVCAPVKALVKSCSSKAGPTALMDQLCSELLAPANATADSKDPTKLRYGCGVATAAQVNKVSSDLAALEPKVTAAAAQASSLQDTFVQGSNQTAVLRAQVDELKATIAALTAGVQKLQANAANATNLGNITQELAVLAAADSRTAQQLALLEAANQTAAQDIAALKSASQQCACGLELSAVNTSLAAIKAAQAADAAAVSLAKTTVESLNATVTIGAAAIASVNTSLASLAATVANVSAIDLSVYAKTADLANINAVSLGGVPAAQYLRSRVVIYRESSTERNGNLGGRSGADALCSASINRPAGLTQVHAFLSTSATDQIADFPTKYGVPSGLAIEASGVVLARNFTSMLGGLLLTLDDAAGA
ncbi:hypothetical protein MNEG_10317 [Monoraphidium neglectum]|uniref:Uncharacterized protein n=1 Tax=Monoraphidium neglectum TaxID=145388 RepID=A0A0D2M202_9CHLO|nr:hypothetical protein MNEG_10317 [Monoraphidium neglectum]KIY97644.1 hypothetical protein MNEG_10317 [Monoraphidium neglectum]|eukprot:XP_013896664.1 hypothetical protein MNEG_10317 [Monoraphidium neglectum]